jgi:peptidoglycan/LPS O-acetylase OafA/YrhL
VNGIWHTGVTKKYQRLSPKWGRHFLHEITSTRDRHFPALDGLRGIAALMVVAHHSAFTYFLTNTFDKAYLRATGLLWVGVDLFFVLSGFLITNILLDTRKSPNYFRAFYGRRFVRIFPLYYAFLAVFYLLLPAFGIKLTIAEIQAQPWQWTYTANIYDGFHLWPGQNIGHFWTLGIEEQFYLLWPLMVLFSSERYLKRGVIVVFLAIPLLRALCLSAGLSVNFINTFTLCHMDGLLLGALISIAFREGIIEKITSPEYNSILKRFDWGVGGVVLGFILVYCLILRNDQFTLNILTWPPFLQCIGTTIISLPLAYGVMRAVCSDINSLQKVMSLKYLRMIGKYSYALYVLHAPICLWVGWHFPVPNFLQNLPPLWSFLHSLYIIFVQFTLSIIAAVISWNLLEKHFLKLKKYFPYRASKTSMDSGTLTLAEIAE